MLQSSKISQPTGRGERVFKFCKHIISQYCQLFWIHCHRKCFAQLWLQISLPSWWDLSPFNPASSISCQAIGQVQMNHFILAFPKFSKLSVPCQIGNSALKGLGKRVNRMNVAHSPETIWHPWSKWSAQDGIACTYLLENVGLYFLATPTSVPAEIALLLSLKEAVSGLDEKYLVFLCPGQFAKC